jgi:ABC-2 type transport system ATP-binding protein
MKPALEIKNLVKVYKTGVCAVDDISLTVEQGDFFALLGPNGAGKSTTIGIITSLVRKTSGSIHVLGYDLDTQIEEVKTCIGIVPQEFNFAIFNKVEEIVMTQAGYYGLPYKIAKRNTEKYLKLLGLWDKRKQMARMLSGGMKRRLMIARALVHEPKLLILDEPTAGVDIEVRRGMWDFLNEINGDGVTIILTTHYLEEAENLCRNIAIINKGKIIRLAKMNELLKELENEKFILDLVEAKEHGLTINEFPITMINPTSFEVMVPKGKNISELFTQLNAQNIEVKSLRNKANRLEELFLDLTRDETSTGSNKI